jgi:hypothetical protein
MIKVVNQSINAILSALQNSYNLHRMSLSIYFIENCVMLDRNVSYS